MNAAKGKEAPPALSRASAPVPRHAAVDRAFHWLVAVSVIVLLATGFLPVAGVEFAWVTPHWLAGVALTVLVLFHLLRASFVQGLRHMLPSGRDFAIVAGALRHVLGGPPPPRPGKYSPMQKAYHWAVALVLLATVVTGLLMLAKIDTPFWRRDPYFLDTRTWGIVYVVHGYAAMTTLTLVMVHIYLGLRPEKWWLSRSMFSGSISREDYERWFDPELWPAGEGAVGEVRRREQPT